MLRYVTAILNDAGVQFRKPLCGRLNRKIRFSSAHALRNADGSFSHDNKSQCTERWAAELRKFSNCRTDIARACVCVCVRAVTPNAHGFSRALFIYIYIYAIVDNSRQSAESDGYFSPPSSSKDRRLRE